MSEKEYENEGFETEAKIEPEQVVSDLNLTQHSI